MLKDHLWALCSRIWKSYFIKKFFPNVFVPLKEKLSLNIIASGGVSSIEDIIKLAELDIYGAIIGKAYYTGAIDLQNAIKVAKWLLKELFLV